MKLESNARDVLLLITGAQAVAGILILGTLWVSRSQGSKIEVESRVLLNPGGEMKIPIKVSVPPAQVQVEVREIQTEKIKVPDIQIRNDVRPADVVLKAPVGAIDVNVVNLPGATKPEKPTPDPDGDLLPPPKVKK